MALPAIMRRLFAGDGYGPLLKDDIVSKRISIQDWSGAFDYQPATAVRGSNGKPYWSVAASGPNSGGAANPVNDDGSHWVSLPSMADIAAMNYATQSWVGSQGFATQAWVGNQGFATQSWVGSQNYADRPSLFSNGGAGSQLQPGVVPFAENIASNRWNEVASSAFVKTLINSPIYLKPDGDDSKDGLSPAGAVKSFAKAIEIGSSLSKSGFAIIVYGGTYNDSPIFNSNSYSVPLKVHLLLQGSVTVTGSLHLNNASVFINGEYTLTINSNANGAGILLAASKLVSDTTIAVNSAANQFGVYISDGSVVRLNRNISVNTNNNYSPCAIGVFYSSVLSCIQNCYVIGTSLGDGVRVESSSSMDVIDGVLSVAPGTLTGTGLLVSGSSSFRSFTDLSIKGGARCIFTEMGSSFSANGGEIYLYNATDSCIHSANSSTIHFWTSKITCVAASGGTREFVRSDFNSMIYFGTGSIIFNGTVSIIFALYLCSSIFKGNLATISGSVGGTAKSYAVSTNSAFGTDGAGSAVCSGVSGSTAGSTATGGVIV